MTKIFSDASEKEITRTIAQMFNETMNEFVDSDVIIIGAGPAGLTAGRDLARAGVRTLLVEQNNYIGGGYWVGGYMMNPVTVRAPAQKNMGRARRAVPQDYGWTVRHLGPARVLQADCSSM